MLDLGKVCYNDEQHKKKYEQHPQNFKMMVLDFDQKGEKIKGGREKKSGRELSFVELKKIAEELGVQLEVEQKQ